MTSYRWLDRNIAVALHEESLALFGGAPGIRDEGLLESALARPKNLAAYGHPALADLAAAYGGGVVRNHPFIDGNKRTGLLCIAVFLRLNGHNFKPDQADEVATILALAAGELSDEPLSSWVARNLAEPDSG